MEDQEQHPYYHPGGISVTPQARPFGYEFPVHASKAVFHEMCLATAGKHRQTTDQRIFALLKSCYEGMTKKLATEEDFVYYPFKHWYWPAHRPEAKKQVKAALGARLFLDPSTGGPWMYIFNERVDTIDTLEKGEAPEEKTP